MSEVTRILSAIEQGDSHAAEHLLPLVYDELRRLAAQRLADEKPGQTLQATALVHEAYLRLAEEKSLHAENRAHFLGIAAQLMRWILVDYERSRRAAKRGGGVTMISLDHRLAERGSSAQTDVDLLALDQALERLTKLDSQQSQIIELRYFGGLSIEDTSEFLGISPATVKRSWASARAWLLREMSRKELRT